MEYSTNGVNYGTENVGFILSIIGAGAGIISLIIAVIAIVSSWKIFTKAGEAGWKCLIPIYNIVVLLSIVNRPLWFIILFFIPFVNLIVLIMITHDLSKAFGRGVGFTIGLLVLPIIFYPMLAFGNSVYVRPQRLESGI